MTKTALLGPTLIVVLATAGCVSTTGAAGEQRSVAYFSQSGIMQGTPVLSGTRPVLPETGAPLQPAPGANRTVEACRGAAWAEAAKLGARSIEAVSAGPERVSGQGQVIGRVRVRITYERSGTYEVTEATMTCTVDQSGKLVSARR